MRPYAILEAPSILGLRSTGVDQLPAVLLKHGLPERLHGRRAGRVEPHGPRSSERDPLTKTLNAGAIAAYTHRLADAVGSLLDDLPWRCGVAVGTGCYSSMARPIFFSPKPIPTAKPPRWTLPSSPEMGRRCSRNTELEGFWIHVDADCLDDAVMPAVDFRLPGGLVPGELETVLTTALESGHAVGLEITIYNPTLDADGRAGKLLADLLVSVLSKFRA